MAKRKIAKTEKSVSNAWYLVPMLFGLIGSIIVWFAIKNKNREKAKEIAIIGFVLSVVIDIIWIIIEYYFSIVI